MNENWTIRQRDHDVDSRVTPVHLGSTNMFSTRAIPLVSVIYMYKEFWAICGVCQLSCSIKVYTFECFKIDQSHSKSQKLLRKWQVKVHAIELTISSAYLHVDSFLRDSWYYLCSDSSLFECNVKKRTCQLL